MADARWLLWVSLRACAFGSMLVAALTACGANDPTPLDPGTLDPSPAVDSIGMRPSGQVYMDSLGFSVNTRALAFDEAGTYVYSSTERPDSFVWSSSASGVARVDATGSVWSDAWGTAIISVSHAGGATDSIRVRVQDAVDLAWTVPVGPGSIQAGVAIGADATFYVTTQAGDASYLNALSPGGEVLWTLALPRTGPFTSAIGADGTLYVGSFADGGLGRLTAVDPDGRVQWSVEDIAPIRSSPAVGDDGLVYVAGGRHVYAVDPEGDVQWTYEAIKAEFVWSAPAIGDDGTLYVGGMDGRLYAINRDGSHRWTFEKGNSDPIVTSPVIGADGTVYFGALDGRLYALDPDDGRERWRLLVAPNVDVESSPSIGPDGTIYVMACSLFAIAPGGSIRWTYPAGSCGAQPTPVVGHDGSVYFGSFRGMTALDQWGDLLWTHEAEGSILGSPAIGEDGAILVASFTTQGLGQHEGFVQAFSEHGSASGGFNGAAWPTARGGRSNTGRAGG